MFQKREESFRNIRPCLSSVLPVTTANPLREGKGVYTEERKPVRCEFNGKPRQRSKENGMKKMTGDMQEWRRKKPVEGKWTMKKEKDEVRGDR